MDWAEIGKLAVPALIGAGSAIISAVVTSIFAERAARRAAELHEAEMRHRLVESLLPARLDAMEAVFRALQKLKAQNVSVTTELDVIIGSLLWLSPELAAEIVDQLRSLPPVHEGEERSRMLSALQQRLRSASGAGVLNERFGELATAD